MAEDSPCRRTPSTMPSSVHSMGGSVQDSVEIRSHSGTRRLARTSGAQLRIGESRDSGFDAFASPRNDGGYYYALNQPRASPVKEKYSPAAVRAQETISMALSNCRPPSPMICTSEITDSTREANSAQRGQFL